VSHKTGKGCVAIQSPKSKTLAAVVKSFRNTALKIFKK
jgi:hypothetical protein